MRDTDREEALETRFQLVAQTLSSGPRNQLLLGFSVRESWLRSSTSREGRPWGHGEHAEPRDSDSAGRNENIVTHLTRAALLLSQGHAAVTTLNSAQRVIAKFGGQSALAKLLGRRQSTVQHWAKSGSIPPKWHQAIFDLATERDFLFSPSEFCGISVESGKLTGNRNGK